LDGKFEKNVFVQAKNGAIDFQPREPFHPLFGAMPQTPLMMEFQITKEYLGFSTHLAYLASLFKEVLDAETYAKGEGSTVAKVIDGSLDNHVLSGIAGVSNIGNDRNWCGGHMEQANWYAFGRLAWNHELTPETIADEWLRMTFSNDPKFLGIVKPIMLNSRETVVNYMTPLGLHHIMGWDHHYGPMPWNEKAFRMDWTSAYYHKADSTGIGFNRTPTGSNATGQYFPEIGNKFANINTCPENLLLWFHHVSWDYKMKSGQTVWNELCFKYKEGVDSARSMQSEWTRVKGMIDDVRFVKINTYFIIQANEAKWWHDACLTYFQSKSKMPFPQGIDVPKHDLEYYKNLKVVPFRKELDNTLVY
jgi:alpha-glucuronidase